MMSAPDSAQAKPLATGDRASPALHATCLCAITATMLSACAVSPDFVRPAAPDVTQYTNGAHVLDTVAADGQAQRFSSGAAMAGRRGARPGAHRPGAHRSGAHRRRRPGRSRGRSRPRGEVNVIVCGMFQFAGVNSKLAGGVVEMLVSPPVWAIETVAPPGGGTSLSTTEQVDVPLAGKETSCGVTRTSLKARDTAPLVETLMGMIPSG